MPGMTLVPGHKLTLSKANVSLRDITAALITHSCHLDSWSQMLLAMAVLDLCPPYLCHRPQGATNLEITTERTVSFD